MIRNHRPCINSRRGEQGRKRATVLHTNLFCSLGKIPSPGACFLSQKIWIQGFSLQHHFPPYQEVLWCFFLPSSLPSNILIYGPKPVPITQVAASRMIKITRFCLVLPTCRSRAHCVTILRMGKLRHVMVQ